MFAPIYLPSMSDTDIHEALSRGPISVNTPPPASICANHVSRCHQMNSIIWRLSWAEILIAVGAFLAKTPPFGAPRFLL